LGELFLLVFVFACLDKPKKEHFVVALTNAKTKKIMMGLLTDAPTPIAIVTSKG
jgi:hypothetical protein